MKKHIMLSTAFLLSLLVGCSSPVRENPAPSKVVQLENIDQVKSSLPKQIVLVGGCFDLLHYGHIQYLNKAREKGDYLVVALEPDQSIWSRKKKMPFHNQDQRAYNLTALSSVDLVVLLPVLKTYDDYLNLVKIIEPKVIAITPDNPQRKNLLKQAREVGAEVKTVAPFIEGLSSTTLKKYLMKDMDDRCFCTQSAS
ncbi:MAG: adenylyltransferase/cytidyltransferase family protein [Candidatus Nucleicultricaceae bacterium]